jgi:hypothetical protein
VSYKFKQAIYDRLVEDGTIQGFFGAAATGSCAVAPQYLERTGVYPQIIYADTYGPSDPGMNSQNGRIDFIVQVQATGNAPNPHKLYEDIFERISGLFNDVDFSGTAGVYTYHMIREGGPSVLYDPKRKVLTKIVGYSYKIT